MKIVTVPEMVEIEQAADASGHCYDTMMALAGRSVAASIQRHMAPWDSDGGILILVGPGNNGGDGLVAARYLHQWDPSRLVSVYCWKRKPEKNSNFEAVRRLKIPIVHARDDEDYSQLQDMIIDADVIVDALLGTGVSRPIEGDMVDLLAAVRQGLAERTSEESLQDEEIDETAELSSMEAAMALDSLRNFDFLLLTPYDDYQLPQIVAVDCPSGLNCDTGELDPASLAADLTITFANPKTGHFIADGPAACGQIEVADIGTDPGLGDNIQTEMVTPELAKSLLPARPLDAHKGTFGKTMIVAGSVNYTGAAHLSGSAAYRVGAGLVTLGIIASLHPILASNLAESTWLLLPEEMGVLSPTAVKVLAEHMDGYAALLVGPGLSQEEEAVKFVQRLVGIGFQGQRAATVGFLAGQQVSVEEMAPAADDAAAIEEKESDGPAIGFLARRRTSKSSPADFLQDCPLVLDADALNALAQVEDWHTYLPPDTIVTPHPGEMGRLCGCSTAEVQANRIGLAREKAAAWNLVVVLKGAYTVVAAPDGRLAVLPFANPALATAGSGDVLAGAIAGTLSQGIAPFEAALLAGYLHGLTGELARQELGDTGVVAGDLLHKLPTAIRQLRAA
ncbi:MAG: NAD(P)H-hydrate dehydratase [Chloroflexota bacterium]|nr:NAD(P)H-hydrate dehydratase [Chloroflexota bacterium]